MPISLYLGLLERCHELLKIAHGADAIVLVFEDRFTIAHSHEPAQLCEAALVGRLELGPVGRVIGLGVRVGSWVGLGVRVCGYGYGVRVRVTGTGTGRHARGPVVRLKLRLRLRARPRVGAGFEVGSISEQWSKAILRF